MKEKSPIFADSDSALETIQNLMLESDDIQAHEIEIKEGQILFSQGDSIKDLYLLLDGEVSLLREKNKEGINMVADTLKPGSFFGLIAFVTGNASMTTVRVDKDGHALKIRQDEFESFMEQHPDLHNQLRQLILGNLVERYRHTIDLHMEMEQLNGQLKKERNDLKKAYEELENTQNLLVHQEKMATLGQLVAGFAHEINNPTSALMRSTDSVIEQLPKLFEEQYDEARTKKLLFRCGLESRLLSSVEIRERMNEVGKRFPNVSRTILRKLAQMPEEALAKMEDKTGRSPLDIDDLVPYFEAGRMLTNINLSSKRIGDLVKSLKSYSRQDSDSYDWIDLREGLEDTLHVLNNRLKYHEVHLYLKEIPKIYAGGGELNQVWTNIIMNACDAMEKNGTLWIGCGTGQAPAESLAGFGSKEDLGQNESNPEWIWVRIEDSGPGIDEQTLQKIFEPNFTTKRQATQFGLGLGLTLSNNIVKKHGGRVIADNRKEGGASFTVYLPKLPPDAE